jgi:hypothetical protein
MNDFIMLNLDDYHNIHSKRRADTTTTSDVHHFQTILLKAVPDIPAVSFVNTLIEKNIHNPKGIDINLIIENVSHLFFPHLWLTYNERKCAFSGELPKAKNHEEHVEMLLVHSYDNRIQQRRDDRSMNNTKLVNLVEGSLHSTEDYIKALQNVFDVPELESYLEKNISSTSGLSWTALSETCNLILYEFSKYIRAFNTTTSHSSNDWSFACLFK